MSAPKMVWDFLIYNHLPALLIVVIGWYIVDHHAQKRERKKQFIDDLRLMQDKAEEICRLAAKARESQEKTIGYNQSQEKELGYRFGFFRDRLISCTNNISVVKKNAVDAPGLQRAIIQLRRAITGDSLHYPSVGLGEAFKSLIYVIDKIKINL
ncbi:MAG: hypothetical protein LBP33_05535 [Candidatus Adiutrix sp.]|jgi:hypothetical protein|nr:hypothetical protein [Candidatus Adiutrix sp.]